MISLAGPEPDFQYNLDYFSGAQAQIYIGGVLLDEVTTLQWNEHQSKIPLYGYASQYFDEMARGAIIVQGQFSINFIQPNYLYSVLQAITLNSETALESARKKVIQEKLQAVLNSHEEPQDANKANLRETINKMDERHNAGALFKYMNDAIWGPSKEEKITSAEGRVDHVDVNGFDIKVNFQLEGTGRPQCHQIIKNVHILGGSRALVIDEQPVQEVYSFYARKTTSS